MTSKSHTPRQLISQGSSCHVPHLIEQSTASHAKGLFGGY